MYIFGNERDFARLDFQRRLSRRNLVSLKRGFQDPRVYARTRHVYRRREKKTTDGRTGSSGLP